MFVTVMVRTVAGTDDLDVAVDLRDHGLPLGHARLEDFLDARQTRGDVEAAGDAAGVERAHRQLRARLADGLRGDDADRHAVIDELAGGEGLAVAALADAALRPARERRAHMHTLDAGGDDGARRRVR